MILHDLVVRYISLNKAKFSRKGRILGRCSRRGIVSRVSHACYSIALKPRKCLSIRLGAWPIEARISFLKASRASETALHWLFGIVIGDGVARFAVESESEYGTRDDFLRFFDDEQVLIPHYFVILGTKLDSTLCIKSVP